ncbi:hypothetical protein M8998_07500 [Sphingobacterium sp. lm-10]|uniref:hypothetical protein n=1 Tax=Sphingobacterium sp. lm-10 TaxID=2944904 RepID=UPI0020225773|nr:hypothetical protein [Sphingobacterium sp. lm-10]MCL7987780.1 hypothetical protein [Sphingobacterium sp. lm-10]
MSTIHFFDANKSSSGSLGNLEKTINLQHLLETPLPNRDANWIADFLDNIDECNLQLAEPEVAVANDSFPYMNARTVAPETNFKAFVIRNELDTILANGFGLVINAHNDQPDWIFSHGDLLNLKLNNEFYTDESAFSEHGKDFVLPKDEQVLVGQPSEAILPAQTRTHLREFLAYSGMNNGKVMLIARNYEDEQNMTQDLIFNITPKLFATQDAYVQVMNTISWFLPRHYSIAGVDELSVESGFAQI